MGGGVGINPLVSILCEYTDLLTAANLENGSDIKPGKVHLLYSAKTEEELVFKVSKKEGGKIKIATTLCFPLLLCKICSFRININD